jgi:hypothetical protein
MLAWGILAIVVLSDLGPHSDHSLGEVVSPDATVDFSLCVLEVYVENSWLAGQS